MRLKLTFYMDVPEDFTAQGYGSTITAVRRTLNAVGLRTTVWRFDYAPGEQPVPPINCNGPSGAAS